MVTYKGVFEIVFDWKTKRLFTKWSLMRSGHWERVDCIIFSGTLNYFLLGLLNYFLRYHEFSFWPTMHCEFPVEGDCPAHFLFLAAMLKIVLGVLSNRMPKWNIAIETAASNAPKTSPAIFCVKDRMKQNSLQLMQQFQKARAHSSSHDALNAHAADCSSGQAPLAQ